MTSDARGPLRDQILSLLLEITRETGRPHSIGDQMALIELLETDLEFRTAAVSGTERRFGIEMDTNAAFIEGIRGLTALTEYVHARRNGGDPVLRPHCDVYSDFASTMIPGALAGRESAKHGRMLAGRSTFAGFDRYAQGKLGEVLLALGMEGFDVLVE
ncbi:hypothetical protein L0U85_13020 [Glycomyces sp. L485]|uniref:hypothetical protein n=1 Tax=Glycomyces sp. L485 TaxID=2909235 RepID=UPI001F4BBEFF|nr:hypothetical protein [Glycomyces sp. L485]MCH7231766.1 hypothetical protein [Glycomyces sp. L485]